MCRCVYGRCAPKGHCILICVYFARKILAYVDESYRTWKSAKGQVGQAIKLAVQYGYRHLDCAAIYMNEAEIGEALQEVFKDGKVKREDIFITSKLW